MILELISDINTYIRENIIIPYIYGTVHLNVRMEKY